MPNPDSLWDWWHSLAKNTCQKNCNSNVLNILCVSPKIGKTVQRKLNFVLVSLYFKGIVSRDWGALQIILLDRYIVGSISAEGYF